ncbi:multidrug efflux RND transporter permease subunit [Pontibacter sp. BT310]|uniref:Multidrug efflux RND transporter permease subunit n=1 Tax=Pontibacter populi TaxID=890055 RepID=A0ABS6XAJ2_9BACT|nr:MULTISPECIES: multidrug efflux RND transporter permease subunit [Pontibacter]MBJ6118179.1 multidrug efflux RND transporter permease subunit [Pontibacter sp. BT310]MBR0570606.1 multidrug efflux RND transporter permease subunit [Microvirga sp. STS03]MBW3365032.1 multidrug efflux RND transporter permease subunit [Pontibacter populi]
MISDVFIRRPVTSIVISLVIVLVGVLAMMNLPVTQYPDISPPSVSVSANYTGSDALTVEQAVATPVETQINGSPGMAYITSTSTGTGQMNMSVTFEIGTDIDIATLDVQNRASIAQPSLPEEVRRLGVTVRKRNPSIMMVIGIYSPKRTHDVQFLDNYTNIYVKDALMRVKGVGDIFSIGQDFSMRVWLQPDKLAQYNIGAGEITAAIQEQNMQVAAGTVGNSPQHSSQAFQYPITVTGRLQTQEQFGDIIVRTNPADGSVVYLRDVARIEFGKFDYGREAKINGNPATMMLIYQAPGSNALDTAEGIYAALDEMRKSFPADVDYIVSFETVSVVQVSINEVVKTLVEALILVIIVVFLFLQSWRATLIPILAIPVSIIGTFVFFIPLGFTINTLTLFGFVLSIGIVVDDAIVVVEAVQHYIDHEKLSAREATRKAMKDITAPVIAIALILAAVFIPVGFIPGIVGRLYQQFAITIAISVLISAFVALTLTPALCSIMLKPMNVNKNSRGINKFFYKFNNWFARTTESYSTGVRKSIKATPLVLILLACIYVGTFGLFANKPTGFIPTEDEGRLFVSIELPEGASTSRTSAILSEIGEQMATVPAIRNYTSIAGLNAINFSFKSNSGTFFVQLQPWEDRKEEAEKLQGVMAELQQKFAGIKEANILVVAPPAIPGLGASGGFSFVLQQQKAGDVKELEQVMGQFLGAANQRPEIAMAYSFFTAKTPGYHVDVDREKAKRLGVNIADVYATMSTYMGSRYVNDFTRYGRNFRVVAQADTAYRMDIESLKQFYVMNRQGESVPLSALITTKIVENAPVISHYNLFRSVDINGSAAPGYSSGQALQALEEVADQVLPAGYGYEFTGLSREELAAGSSTIYIFSLSILLVLLLLAALYESWSVPFSILFAIPLGMFGAILALTLLPKLDNNVYAQVGMITLIGLAAKNAILIVEFAKERVDRGMELIEATIEAVKLRLRPIIMTSLAFILGVLPLATATGAGAVSRQTIGWVVIGGMLAATFLAIFVVPVLYVIITRLAYGKKGLAELRAQADNRPNEDDGGDPAYVNPHS